MIRIFLIILLIPRSVYAFDDFKESEYCNGSQFEMNTCSKEKFEYYDNILNNLYKLQIHYLEKDYDNLKFKKETGFDGKYGERLRKAQRSWIKFRDSDCDYQAGPENGSIWPLIYFSCMADRTRKRVIDLEEYGFFRV